MTDFGDDSPAAIAARLEFVRNHFGFNQSEFAGALNIQSRVYTNWKLGQPQRLSLNGGIKIAKTFNVSLDFLYLGHTGLLPKDMAQAWVQRHGT